MAIIVKRKNRECVDFARAEITITNKDVGSTIDFAGVLPGFTIIDANLSVQEAFDGNNSISLGLEGDLDKFIANTNVTTIKGAGFKNIQYKALKPTSVLVNVTGNASSSGKAIVSIVYAKNASSRTDY